jgi:hypothetical protein
VNNPVSEKTHLNFRESRSHTRFDTTTGRNQLRSPTPMSRRVLSHSPERIGKVATDSTGKIITVTGHTIDVSTLSDETKDLIKRHGTAKVAGYDPNFKFG